LKILFIWPNNDSWGYKPVGLSLLSALAKRLGWETRVFDTTEIDFDYTNNIASGGSAKIYKPVDISPFDLSKKKINLEKRRRIN